MKKETLSSGNKWILFGSIVVLAFIIYFVWFHKWDANVPEQFADTNCVNSLKGGKDATVTNLLLEWLKVKPSNLLEDPVAKTCMDMFAFTKANDGTKDPYYTTYGQYLAKLAGNPTILNKYIDFDFNQVLTNDPDTPTKTNTKIAFAKKFLTGFMIPLKENLIYIRDLLENPDSLYRKNKDGTYSQPYLDKTVLYINAWLAKYQKLTTSDMNFQNTQINPIMLFLKDPKVVGYPYEDVNQSPVKQWLPAFADYVFNFEGVSGADAVKCNISPDILETSSQALKTMAAYNYIRALYLERARLRKINLETDYNLSDDDIKTVTEKFTDGLILGVSIVNKIANDYYKPLKDQPTTNWNDIIDGEIVEINGGYKLRSSMDKNKPAPPIPNPKLLDELMSFNTKCKAINTKDTRCFDLVKFVCGNINNLITMTACTVPGLPEFVFTPTVMTSTICGPKGTTQTTTTAPATTTTAAAGGTTTTTTTTTAAAGGTTTTTTAAAGGSTETSTTVNIALDTTYQELYNLLRSKLGVLYDGKEGDLSADLIKLIQTMGPVERASLCQVYCNLKQECSQLCKELKCPNCFIEDKADSEKGGQPDTTLGYAGINDAYMLLDYLKGDYLGINPNVSSTQPINTGASQSARGPVINQKDTNGISNVFAPYIVMMPKRPGESYGSYLLNDPNDPAYRDFIDKLVNEY